MKEKFTKEQEPFIIVSCELVTVAYTPVLEVHTADNKKYWLPISMRLDILEAVQGNYEKSEKIILEAKALKILYRNRLIDGDNRNKE